MKQLFNTVFIIICTGLFFACKKDNAGNELASRNLSEINQTSIVGKWNIVTDSTFTGVGVSQQPSDYNGKAGDYFDFRTDGLVYTKEGNVLDTLKYSFKSNNQVIISSFGVTLNGVPEISNITTTAANKIVIFAPWIFTPGGIFGRKITLAY